MKIAIGSDHAGFLLKESLKGYLIEKGFEVKDFGTHSEERADYPDFGHAVANSINNKENELGVLICGSGIGISITANKHKDIRAALCWNKEIATLSRQHNDANIIVLPARFISDEDAKKCIDVFFSTNFEGGRHLDRVKKINL
jgi:ribose 5-phosphate isomerase B